MKEKILAQNKLRPGWVKSGQELADYFEEEWQEYTEAITSVYIGAGPQMLAQEMADIYILYAQLEEQGEETESQVDRTLEVLFLADDLGIDMDQAIEQKLRRNSIKYTADYIQEGTDCIQESKNLYQAMGGDEAFYYAYMMICHAEATSSQNI